MKAKPVWAVAGVVLVALASQVSAQMNTRGASPTDSPAREAEQRREAIQDRLDTQRQAAEQRREAQQRRSDERLKAAEQQRKAMEQEALRRREALTR